MLEQGQAENRRRKRNAILKVLLQAASLTFLAEWGDRSQLATVVLATREDAIGVVVGGSLGHALCTGLAVIGGRMVAQKISVRTGEYFDLQMLLRSFKNWHCRLFYFIFIKVRKKNRNKKADSLFNERWSSSFMGVSNRSF